MCVAIKYQDIFIGPKFKNVFKISMFKRKFPLEFFFHSCEYLLGLNRIISYIMIKFLGPWIIIPKDTNNPNKRELKLSQLQMKPWNLADRIYYVVWEIAMFYNFISKTHLNNREILPNPDNHKINHFASLRMSPSNGYYRYVIDMLSAKSQLSLYM